MKRLTVIITGANGTIGFETAKQFSAHGHELILSCREQHMAELEELIANAGLAKNGANIQIIPLDMLDESSIVEAAEKLSQVRFDVLINNAGALTRAKLTDPGLDVFEEMININLRGPYYLMKYILPLANYNATIINICSDANAYGRPELSEYIAAKGGLESLSLAMRREFPNLKIHPVRIGWTSSNMSDFHPDAMPAEYVATQIFKIATGVSEAPEDTVIFGVGPVFGQEELPKFYPIPYLS